VGLPTIGSPVADRRSVLPLQYRMPEQLAAGAQANLRPMVTWTLQTVVVQCADNRFTGDRARLVNLNPQS
jgi:hypothetical protein